MAPSVNETDGVKWWVYQRLLLDDGRWDVQVQLDTGAMLRIILEPADRFDTVIAAAVAARIRNDRRWTKRSDRG